MLWNLRFGPKFFGIIIHKTFQMLAMLACLAALPQASRTAPTNCSVPAAPPAIQDSHPLLSCGSEFINMYRSDAGRLQLQPDDDGRLPVVFHVIRDDSGASGCQPRSGSVELELSEILEHTNTLFQNRTENTDEPTETRQELVFFIDQIVDGRERVTHRATKFLRVTEENANEVRSRLGIPNKINVFLVDKIIFNGEKVDGFSSYPGSDVQGIVVDWFDLELAAGPTSLLAHELGHLFFLFHTYETELFGRELVTRDPSNCENRGDKLCDTPADPGWGFYLITPDSCAYLANDVDPTGAPYTPDPQNIMSAASIGCTTSFTSGQIDKMLKAFESAIVGRKAPQLPPEIEVLAFPNPPSTQYHQVTIRFETPGGFSRGDIGIYDAQGKFVRRLYLGWIDGFDSSQHVLWDQKNDRGKVVPSGTYFVRARLTGSSGEETIGHSTITVIK
jgi:hypothetical protein